MVPLLKYPLNRTAACQQVPTVVGFQISRLRCDTASPCPVSSTGVEKATGVPLTSLCALKAIDLESERVALEKGRVLADDLQRAHGIKLIRPEKSPVGDFFSGSTNHGNVIPNLQSLEPSLQRVSGLRLCSALLPSLRKFVDIPWDSGSPEPHISYSPRPAHDFGWWKYAPRFHRNESCYFPIITILTVYRPGPRHTNNGLSYLMGLYPCPRPAT